VARRVLQAQEERADAAAINRGKAGEIDREIAHPTRQRRAHAP